ncbi:MAG: amidohydrolase family protein [Alphaproteobacteria bacterium]
MSESQSAGAAEPPIPPGACDCHFHVFGPTVRFPYAEERSFTPPEAPVEAYRALMGRLGLERAVIVQPSVYATDNRCTLDAIARLEPVCRGVAVVSGGESERELRRLHDAGVRGVRFNLLYKGGPSLDALESVANRIKAFGWHVQLLVDGRDLPEIRPRLAALPVDIVVDHLGHMPASCGVDHPGFRTLLALLGDGRSWVKLSGAYRISERGPPYADAAPFARALIAAAPERLVWGTDWPHPAFDGPAPDDAVLLDLVRRWAGDAARFRKILVDNPARLYGF